MCGFVGLVGIEPVAPALYLGLQAIQHRGQDACGMATWSAGHLQVFKDLGKVEEVFGSQHGAENATGNGAGRSRNPTGPVLGTLGGTSGIAHVRYPTVGISTRNDAQPFFTQRPAIVAAHNGNVTNLPEVYAHLAARGVRPMSTCDAEPILLVLADELLKQKVVDFTEDDVVLAARRTGEIVRGSYSMVAVMEVSGRETLICFRDPFGIRPAVYGRRSDGAWMVASESVSFDVVDFQRVGDVPPGAIVFLRKGEEPIVREVAVRELRHCVFEDIYFARPDSIMEGIRVYSRRWQLGERLAQEWKEKGLKADVIVAVPDTSRPAAQAMAETLGIAYREGFIKNRYSGRTFIMPDQRSRETAMRLKLNPIEEIFRDQRVILVDDSIVRGTTMRRIVEMVRRMQPRELHVAIFSPPVRHPCFYGIDMPSRSELVAHQAFVENGVSLEANLAQKFGADTVTFLSEEGLRSAAGTAICNACFTGEYPIPVNTDEQSYIQQDRRGTDATPAAVRGPSEGGSRPPGTPRDRTE